MLARVITTSSDETLFIPLSSDAFQWKGRIYRFGPKGLTVERFTSKGLQWVESADLRVLR